jgi:hypothetical protein
MAEQDTHRNRLKRLQALLPAEGAKRAEPPKQRAYTRAGDNAYLLDRFGQPSRLRMRARINYLCDAYGLDWLKCQRLHDMLLTSVRELDDEGLYSLVAEIELAAAASRNGVNPEDLFERYL